MGRSRGHAVLAIALAFGLGLASPAAAAPGDELTLQDPALAASNALAADFTREYYWTSVPAPEGAAVIQAIDADGAKVGDVWFDAAVTSVDALSVFNDMVYVGDIADPQLSRQSIDVYRIGEPTIGANVLYSHWTLSYPDGPHDAATMMVSSRGNIWIVTKESPGRLYYVPAPDQSGALQLQYVAQAPDWVTDGTFIDGNTAVLRTYTSVIVYDMTLYDELARAAAPEQPQGESISRSLDGDGLVLGSRDDPRLIGVARPEGMADLPPAPSIPPASVQPVEPTPTPTPTPTPEPEPGPVDVNKTRSALLIAAGVSVLAALIAYIGGRPRPRRR